MIYFNELAVISIITCIIGGVRTDEGTARKDETATNETLARGRRDASEVNTYIVTIGRPTLGVPEHNSSENLIWAPEDGSRESTVLPLRREQPETANLGNSISDGQLSSLGRARSAFVLRSPSEGLRSSSGDSSSAHLVNNTSELLSSSSAGARRAHPKITTNDVSLSLGLTTVRNASNTAKDLSSSSLGSTSVHSVNSTAEGLLTSSAHLVISTRENLSSSPVDSTLAFLVKNTSEDLFSSSVASMRKHLVRKTAKDLPSFSRATSIKDVGNRSSDNLKSSMSAHVVTRKCKCHHSFSGGSGITHHVNGTSDGFATILEGSARNPLANNSSKGLCSSPDVTTITPHINNVSDGSAATSNLVNITHERLTLSPGDRTSVPIMNVTSESLTSLSGDQTSRSVNSTFESLILSPNGSKSAHAVKNTSESSTVPPRSSTTAPSEESTEDLNLSPRSSTGSYTTNNTAEGPALSPERLTTAHIVKRTSKSSMLSEDSRSTYTVTTTAESLTLSLENSMSSHLVNGTSENSTLSSRKPITAHPVNNTMESLTLMPGGPTNVHTANNTFDSLILPSGGSTSAHAMNNTSEKLTLTSRGPVSASTKNSTSEYSANSSASSRPLNNSENVFFSPGGLTSVLVVTNLSADVTQFKKASEGFSSSAGDTSQFLANASSEGLTLSSEWPVTTNSSLESGAALPAYAHAMDPTSPTGSPTRTRFGNNTSQSGRSLTTSSANSLLMNNGSEGLISTFQKSSHIVSSTYEGSTMSTACTFNAHLESSIAEEQKILPTATSEPSVTSSHEISRACIECTASDLFINGSTLIPVTSTPLMSEISKDISLSDITTPSLAKSTSEYLSTLKEDSKNIIFVSSTSEAESMSIGDHGIEMSSTPSVGPRNTYLVSSTQMPEYPKNTYLVSSTSENLMSTTVVPTNSHNGTSEDLTAAPFNTSTPQISRHPSPKHASILALSTAYETKTLKPGVAHFVDHDTFQNRLKFSLNSTSKNSFSTLEIRKGLVQSFEQDTPRNASKAALNSTSTTAGSEASKTTNTSLTPSNTPDSRVDTVGSLSSNTEQPSTETGGLMDSVLEDDEEPMKLSGHVPIIVRDTLREPQNQYPIDKRFRGDTNRYFYKITIPSFLGLLLFVVLVYFCLRTRGYFCRLFQPDDHGSLVEEQHWE